jgi:hypothetical protein
MIPGLYEVIQHTLSLSLLTHCRPAHTNTTHHPPRPPLPAPLGPKAPPEAGETAPQPLPGELQPGPGAPQPRQIIVKKNRTHCAKAKKQRTSHILVLVFFTSTYDLQHMTLILNPAACPCGRCGQQLSQKLLDQSIHHRDDKSAPSVSQSTTIGVPPPPRSVPIQPPLEVA